MALSLALVGCGAMGSALLKGWMTIPDSKDIFKDLWVIAPHREKVEPFLGDSRVQWFPSPDQLPRSPDLILFAVKPFQLEDVLPFYKDFPSLCVSVATGKPLSFYKTYLTSSSLILRLMPNTPVAIHKGVLAFYGGKPLSQEQGNQVKRTFQGLGFCLWVTSEEDLDKITAVSGSGPAYVFYLMESLAESAEALGFPKDIAQGLALNTFLGASSYAELSDLSPVVLREHVTSPQGTTAAALALFEKGKVKEVMKNAVKAAFVRAMELSQ